MRYDIYRRQNEEWKLAAVTDERILAIHQAKMYYEVDRERYISHGVKIWDNDEKRWCYLREC